MMLVCEACTARFVCLQGYVINVGALIHYIYVHRRYWSSVARCYVVVSIVARDRATPRYVSPKLIESMSSI